MAITKDQVFQAADELFAEGKAPSLVEIRKMIGSGSYSTISSMLAEWKSASRAGEVVDVDVPDEIQDAIDAAGARIWAAAVKLAESGVQLTKDESAQLAKDAQAARDEALQLATDLTDENEKLVKQCTMLQGQVEAVEWQKIELNQELAKLRSVVEEQRESYRQLLARLPVAAKKVVPAKAAPVSKGRAK